MLLPISSLSSDYGIGTFSNTAYRFIDWLVKAGQSYWQILPTGPTGYGDSPYQSFSTFAGNPYFISLEKLIEKGLLTVEECRSQGFTNSRSVNYKKLYRKRFALLHKAYMRSNVAEYQSLCLDEYTEDYLLFMAIKDYFGGVSWNLWDEDIRLRQSDALKKYQRLLADKIGFYRFLQIEFHNEWRELKAYAEKNKIKIIGDLPIYVAFDSADVWANPELFDLDKKGLPRSVAGCPPDGFSPDGQLWGNPLYRWGIHKKNGYSWWCERIKYAFSLYDVVRIDHFRGFDEYYSIEYGETTARNGAWKKGPSIDFFKSIEKTLGKKDFIAEDLGFMTDSVKELVRKSRFPSMRVLEFAFDSRDGNFNDHLPHNYPVNSVAYTGTHDNEPLVSWLSSISGEELQRVRGYLCDDKTQLKKLVFPLIGLLMRSPSRLVIIPMQDYLALGAESRMNTPSTVGGNWKWRMKDTDTSDLLAEKISRLTELSGRGR